MNRESIDLGNGELIIIGMVWGIKKEIVWWIEKWMVWGMVIRMVWGKRRNWFGK